MIQSLVLIRFSPVQVFVLILNILFIFIYIKKNVIFPCSFYIIDHKTTVEEIMMHIVYQWNVLTSWWETSAIPHARAAAVFYFYLKYLSIINCFFFVCLFLSLTLLYCRQVVCKSITIKVSWLSYIILWKCWGGRYGWRIICMVWCLFNEWKNEIVGQ